MSKKTEELLALIPGGKENAIPLRILAMRLNVGTRAAKAHVRQARSEGALIMSDDSGYWRAETQEEISAYLSWMKRQAISRLATIKTAADAACLEGQMSFMDDAGELMAEISVAMEHKPNE